LENKKKDVGNVKTFEEEKREERQRFEKMTVLIWIFKLRQPRWRVGGDDFFINADVLVNEINNPTSILP
jgi:hypothetical protein